MVRLSLLSSLMYFLLTSTATFSNNCNRVILTDDYSNPSLWQSVGDGGVNINNGTCNFDNVYNGYYNKVIRNLNTTLSDTYWKAECDFSILSPNPSGSGTANILMALTAGDLDFISYDLSQNYLETSQDGIAVLIYSDAVNDNNINNWYFLLEGKKGDNREFDTSIKINANSNISNYYLSMERISLDSVKLSVFSDAARTVHLPGSPIFYEIDPNITGLNTIQQGVATRGAYERFINANVDNLVICDNGTLNSIEKLENNLNINIYPNPSEHEIHILLNNNTAKSNHQYAVYSTLGQLVLSGNIENENTILNIGSISKGTYILHVYSDKGYSFKKFQKL